MHRKIQSFFHQYFHFLFQYHWKFINNDKLNKWWKKRGRMEWKCVEFWDYCLLGCCSLILNSILGQLLHPYPTVHTTYTNNKIIERRIEQKKKKAGRMKWKCIQKHISFLFALLFCVFFRFILILLTFCNTLIRAIFA